MAVRRVRVSFSDPDATDDSDSDSDSAAADDNDTTISGSRKPGRAGRSVTVILLGGRTTMVLNGARGSSRVVRAITRRPGSRRRSGAPAAAAVAAGPSPSSGKIVRGAAEDGSTTKKRFSGVYERQAGRWAADFRDHRLKVRRWLGTFPSEEEAKAAYDAFESQLRSSLSRGAPAIVLPPPPAHVRRGVKIHPALHPSPTGGDKLKPEIPTTATAGSRATTVTSLSSGDAPPVCSLTTPPSAARAVASQTKTRQRGDDHQPAGAATAAITLIEPFLEEEVADEADLIGLADLGHLPLPFLDGHMDIDLSDLSLFDIGFR